MDKDTLGRWIVDELVHDPHYPNNAVARDGDKWWLVSSFKGVEPKEYKARVNEAWMRLSWNHELYLYNCVPRGGFKVPVGRAITTDEWGDLVAEFGLTDDDISNVFEDQKGGIYGPDAVVRYPSRQIKVDNHAAISLESRLRNLGIEASNGSPGRLNIRVDPDSGQAERGRKGGAATSEAKRAASAENGKKGGRPRKDPASAPLPLELAVAKDGKPRTLRLVSGGGRQYECVVIYPDGQQVRAKVQPTAGGGIPDLRFLAEKNGFEV